MGHHPKEKDDALFVYRSVLKLTEVEYLPIMTRTLGLPSHSLRRVNLVSSLLFTDLSNRLFPHLRK